jgi:hypothetical protein
MEIKAIHSHALRAYRSHFTSPQCNLENAFQHIHSELSTRYYYPVGRLSLGVWVSKRGVVSSCWSPTQENTNSATQLTAAKNLIGVLAEYVVSAAQLFVHGRAYNHKPVHRTCSEAPAHLISTPTPCSTDKLFIKLYPITPPGLYFVARRNRRPWT